MCLPSVSKTLLSALSVELQTSSVGKNARRPRFVVVEYHALPLLFPPTSSFHSLFSTPQAQKLTATKSSASSSSAISAPVQQQNLPNKILFVENLPVEVTGVRYVSCVCNNGTTSWY
jgi:hypothetical protein